MANPTLAAAGSWLADIEERLGNLTPFMEAVGLIVKNSALKNFDNQASPEGDQWASLHPRTIKERAAQGYGPTPILYRRGELKDSIISVLQSASVVSVGSPLPFAGVLHAGAETPSKIPARPFIGITPADELNIWAALAAHTGL